MPVRVLLSFVLTLWLGAGFSAGLDTLSTAHAISTRDFFRMFSGLSEPEGYFDSDNFISNERAYLRIFPDLKRQGVSGGAYLGVGPDQNYSYIAHLNPRIAFIIDIRRQNALQHFYFKALFQQSSNRLEYIERLFGKRVRSAIRDPQSRGISELLKELDASPSDARFAEKKLTEALAVIRSWHPDLGNSDYASIRLIARAFIENGPDLKFTSFNRPPRAHYPSYRQLLEETDSEGVQANYLATEQDFQQIKTMHRENRIIPIVGDLAGEQALLHIGQELSRRNMSMTCFYVSNVEFYLFRSGRWDAYIRNLNSIPRAQNAFIIRTYANYPQPAYYMQTVIERVQNFLGDEKAGKHDSYWNLIPPLLRR